MTLRIRAAERNDAPLIQQFITELAEYEHLADEVEASEDDLVRELFGASPRVFCQIGEIDGRPAGFALWYYTFSTFQGRHGIWLEDLFVRPDARGAGLGKALLSDLAKRCVREELGRLEWAVLDWNEPSIEFYRRQGAMFLDEWHRCRVTDVALRRLGGK